MSCRQAAVVIILPGLLLGALVAFSPIQEERSDVLRNEAAAIAELNGFELVSFSGSRRIEWGDKPTVAAKAVFKQKDGNTQEWWFLTPADRVDTNFYLSLEYLPETLERAARFQRLWTAAAP
jgi:hypothetical protein